MSRTRAFRIVTLSREFGSGGGALARDLGRRLEWRVVDRQVVQKIAAELRVSEEEIAARDERVRGMVERVGTYLSGAFPELVPPPLPPTRVDDETLRVLCEAVLREAARIPPVIVVGHGAQCLFQDRDDALHVRIVMPLEGRVRRLERLRQMSSQVAAEEARDRDRAREDYIRHHYGRRWDDPALYHLVLNLGRLDPVDAVDLLDRLLRSGDG